MQRKGNAGAPVPYRHFLDDLYRASLGKDNTYPAIVLSLMSRQRQIFHWMAKLPVAARSLQPRHLVAQSGIVNFDQGLNTHYTIDL